MLANDPECSQVTALRDLLNLARHKLLAVNPPTVYEDPGENERINARLFRKELDAILQRSKNNGAYLFTGANREGVLTPNAVLDSLQM